MVSLTPYLIKTENIKESNVVDQNILDSFYPEPIEVEVNSSTNNKKTFKTKDSFSIEVGAELNPEADGYKIYLEADINSTNDYIYSYSILINGRDNIKKVWTPANLTSIGNDYYGFRASVNELAGDYYNFNYLENGNNWLIDGKNYLSQNFNAGEMDNFSGNIDATIVIEKYVSNGGNEFTYQQVYFRDSQDTTLNPSFEYNVDEITTSPDYSSIEFNMKFKNLPSYITSATQSSLRIYFNLYSHLKWKDQNWNGGISTYNRYTQSFSFGTFAQIDNGPLGTDFILNVDWNSLPVDLITSANALAIQPIIAFDNNDNNFNDLNSVKTLTLNQPSITQIGDTTFWINSNGDLYPSTEVTWWYITSIGVAAAFALLFSFMFFKQYLKNKKTYKEKDLENSSLDRAKK